MPRLCRRSWTSWSSSVDILEYKSHSLPKVPATLPAAVDPLKPSFSKTPWSPGSPKAKPTPHFLDMLGKEQYIGGAAVAGLLRNPTADDPYRYQFGFGNHHVTEAIPGALPLNGTNLPQKGRYGLYAEHLNGTSFISSRESVSNV